VDLIVASKEIGLEVNVDQTKHMVVCRDHKAGRRNSIKTEINSFEAVQQLRYLCKT
jgi:hypothetical protein